MSQAFSYDTSLYFSSPNKPCLSAPSAFPALGYLLQLAVVQWSHSLSYLFNCIVSFSKQRLLFTCLSCLLQQSVGHGRCSGRTTGWLTLDAILCSAFGITLSRRWGNNQEATSSWVQNLKLNQWGSFRDWIGLSSIYCCWPAALIFYEEKDASHRLFLILSHQR